MGLPCPVESYSTDELVKVIRDAMSQGCIHPCHVYDAVDEILKRVVKLEDDANLLGSCLDKMRVHHSREIRELRDTIKELE